MGVVISGDDGERWAEVEPGSEYRVGRGGTVPVDRQISTSEHVSRHACTIRPTAESYWVENWGGYDKITVVDLGATGVSLDVAPSTRCLSPFPTARVEIMTSRTDVVGFSVACETLADLTHLDIHHDDAAGPPTSMTRSLGEEIRRVIRTQVDSSSRRRANVREWYACVALCEPMLVPPVADRVPSHQEIALRIGRLVDVDSGGFVEEEGRPATTAAIGHRLKSVREKLDLIMRIDGDGSGLGDANAPLVLARLLVRTGAVGHPDVERYLGHGGPAS